MSGADDLTQALLDAVGFHQAGNLPQAEQQYRRILEHNPDQPDALNLLGVLVQTKGDLDGALALFDRAIAAAPDLPTVPYNKANALRDAGRTDEAIATYKAALDIEPAYADARLNLGALLHDSGNAPAAAAQFKALISAAPNTAKAHYNLGKCRQTQGRLDDARDALNTAIAIDPNDPDAHFELANVLSELNAFDDAITHIKKALNLKPKWPEAISAMGMMLGLNGQQDEAVKTCLAALDLSPRNAMFHFNLGHVHYQAGHNDAASKAFLDSRKNCDTNEGELLAIAGRARAVTDPWVCLGFVDEAHKMNQSSATLGNMGLAFRDLDLNTIARVCYDSAIDRDGTYLPALKGRGKLNISSGRLSEGWDDLSRSVANTQTNEADGTQSALWQGEDLRSKTVLVTLEEGIGDQILYSTMLPDMVTKSKRCIVECSRRLVPVLSRSLPDADVTDWMDPHQRKQNRSRADFFSPAVNLGRYLRRDFKDFPATAGHLKPNSALVAEYREKYVQAANGRRIVGISWLSGNTEVGPYKTIDLEALLAKVDPNSAMFVNLQYGSVRDHLQEVEANTGVSVVLEDSFDQLTDIERYFAQIAALDLVITISNTAAHVSGSLGVPTFLMLSRGAGAFYYWFLERSDSPWYPSVRIFRQRSIINLEKKWWAEVLADVSEALDAWASHPLPPRMDT